MRPQILERKLHEIPPDEGLYKTYNAFQLCEHASIAVEDSQKDDHQLAIVASLIPMSFELTTTLKFSAKNDSKTTMMPVIVLWEAWSPVA